MIDTYRRDDVLEIVLNSPPVNALGTAERKGILDALESARDDARIKAIVIRGDGKCFSAGADITEFGEPHVLPSLPTVIDACEASWKPIVAAIHGAALAGGLEVAMACHYRVATPAAMFGMPEVKIGVLPATGGTQRLPRLINVEAALDMVVSGDPIPGTKALLLGLVDKLTDDGRLAEEAIAFARMVNGVRRTGDLHLKIDPGLFDRYAKENARKIKGLDAPQACIEAFKATAELSIDEGQAKERELFDKLVKGDQSKALRHVYFAERAAAKIDGLPEDAPVRPIEKVGVIGAGTMGAGISMNFLSRGISVTIVETTQEALDRGAGVMRKNYQASAAKGRIEPEQVVNAMGLLNPTLDFGALADCDLIIEAVYEDLDLKKEVFAKLDKIARQGAILASNTSLLDIDQMAAVTSRPGDVLGLHFFSPANVMKLVEVIRGAKTTPDVLATGMKIAQKIGKVPVVSGVCHGFIGNRMLLQRHENSLSLLLEGATPEQIDRVHIEFGMPMGPFQMVDLAGVDIGWHRDPARIECLQDALCSIGRTGQKARAGYYDYDDNRRSSSSPVVSKIIEDFRKSAGTTPRPISDDEIVVRTLFTMVNEAAKILEERIAQRASDIDVVYVYGFGWPRHKGGPMFWAQQIGLKTIFKSLERYREKLGPDFKLSRLLRERADSGEPFDR
jgi:3-hydroxyacyl-CoA dehydrogenase